MRTCSTGLALLLGFAIPGAAIAETVSSAPVAASSPVSASGPHVRGSGDIVEDRRAVSGFVAVHTRGPIDVELRAAAGDAVTVVADDNLVALIETRVSDGERPALEISLQPGASFRARRTPRVIVEFRTLSELVVQGSGHAHADRIVGDDFALSMSGSGDVRIDSLEVKLFGAVLAGSGDLRVVGHAEQQAFRVAGSGDVHADGLQGRHVKAAIAGSGDARLNALDSLEVSIAGSGDVVYRGRPEITQRLLGSGTVRRAR